jgi:hypothetical protein
LTALVVDRVRVLDARTLPAPFLMLSIREDAYAFSADWVSFAESCLLDGVMGITTIAVEEGRDDLAAFDVGYVKPFPGEEALGGSAEPAAEDFGKGELAVVALAAGDDESVISDLGGGVCEQLEALASGVLGPVEAPGIAMKPGFEGTVGFAEGVAGAVVLW